MRRHPFVHDREEPRAVRLGGAVPLQWMLPLLVTVFVAVGLAVMLAFAYSTLRHRAEAIVRDRLESASRQVASSARASIDQRAATLRAAARDTALRRVLLAARDGRSPAAADLSAARGVLGGLLLQRDSTLPVELWDARGRPVAHAGPALPAGDPRPPPPDAAAAPDSVRLSPLLAYGRKVRFWALAPVVAGGARLGWIAQPHNVGGPRDATKALRDLLSEDVALYTRNADGRFWATASGTVAAVPERDSTVHGLRYQRPGTGTVLAAEAPVAGTPWVMVLETPERWVLQRPRATLRPLALAGLLLTAAAAALAWLVGRRVTRPLAELTAAAEALARGRYERPVAGRGRDEIGRLAASFDAMARQVAAARRELERRVDEAQRARADAERARAEAELASRAKSDFLAVMSHELRTPLNAIGGYAELMEMGLHGPVTDAQKEALSRIVRSQAHLLTLINDVLSFARIEAGQVSYTIADVSLHETLAGLEGMVAPQVAASRLSFRCRPCPPEVAARADADKVRQVLLNLLGNAIKYTPAGGSVSVECDADDRFVRVRVRDTGTGIRAERLPHIFDPFVQGERALNRPDEGVGLGLAISRDLARGMGGDLDVESEPGKGSTFTLLLQRAGVASAPVAAVGESSAA